MGSESLSGAAGFCRCHEEGTYNDLDNLNEDVQYIGTRGDTDWGRLTQSETPYWALFEARYTAKKTTTPTEYISPDSMTMCMARRRLEVLSRPVPANALRVHRSVDHILYTIKAGKDDESARQYLSKHGGPWNTGGNKVEDKGDDQGRCDERL